MITTTEHERAAYMTGDTTRADLLARIAALERTIDDLETELYVARHEQAYGGAE